MCVCQGIANAAGMAAAAKMAAAQFNTDKHTIFSNHIVALCGDGCMQVCIAVVEFDALRGAKDLE